MKEHVEIIQEQGPLSIRLFVQDSTGRSCKQMPKHMLEHVTSVSASAMCLDDHQSTLPRWWPHGHLPGGDLTSLVPFPWGQGK